MEFGLSSYEKMADIEKLKEEKQFIHEQLLELRQKHEQAPDSLQAEFQKKLADFYHASVGNHGFKQVKITQDSGRLQKLRRNK